MTVDPVADKYRQSVLRTYRYLRLGMVVLVVLLGVALILERWRAGHLLDSISAYYYTPAHAVFVASLCAVGSCLVIYRGRSDVEDVILNGAGFLAFVVAFVPTSRGEAECNPQAAFCDIPVSTVEANITALLTIGAVGLVLGYLISVRPRQVTAHAQPIDAPARTLFYALTIGFVLLVAAFILARERFLQWGHYSAAVLLFLAMVVVVVLSGRHLDREHGASPGNHTMLRRWYWGSFAFMIVAIVVILVAGWAGLDHWVFYLEGSVIIGFAVFWIIQTFGEVWDEPAA
jgi:hypothetical protein